MEYGLKWDSDGSRTFEYGVSRGVLYFEETPSVWTGVPWNGLVSVTQNVSGGETASNYYEGRKVFEWVSSEDYQATLEAFTYPDEFDKFNGVVETTTPGFYATLQPRNSRFRLSYRTEVADDSNPDGIGYKIHLVYGCAATPSEKSHRTLRDIVEGQTFTWTITGTPQNLDGFKPTAYAILDSREMNQNAMTYIEDILYGTPSSPSSARLPSMSALRLLAHGALTSNLLDGNPSAPSPGFSDIDGNVGVGEYLVISGGTARHNVVYPTT